MSKQFIKAKEKALKAVQKDIEKTSSRKYGKPSEYDLRDEEKIQLLKDFPLNNRELVDVDVKFKAIFLKAQLEKEFPQAEIKVRIERYSGGSAIDAWVKGEVDENKASEIGHLYSNSGNTDLMTDYFDYDNYVHVMCKNDGILNSPIVMLGKEMPGEDRDQVLKEILS